MDSSGFPPVGPARRHAQHSTIARQKSGHRLVLFQRAPRTCQESGDLHCVFDVLQRDSRSIRLAFFSKTDRLIRCERRNRDGQKDGKGFFHGLSTAARRVRDLPTLFVSANGANL